MNHETNVATRSTLAGAALALAIATLPATAGSDAKTPIIDPPTNNGDWCTWLKGKPGTLYKNAANPYIQEVGIFGRFHWQYAYVDGSGSDVAGSRRFNYDTEEIRRFRLGAKIKFLNYFTLSGNADLEDDRAPTGKERDHDIEYAGIYFATLAFDAAKAFSMSSVDKLVISVGKHKVINNAEEALSSKKIKTIERSAIAGYSNASTSTGLAIKGQKGLWSFGLGIFSGDNEPEFSEFDGSNDYFYTLHVGREIEGGLCSFDESRVDFRLAINGDDLENNSGNTQSPGTFNIDWVASLSTTSHKGRLGLLTDLIYGENGKNNPGGISNPNREGSFWGIVLLPTYEIVEGKVEGVFRYQYAHASKREGFRIGSRYARRAGDVTGVTGPKSGRGDSHHSFYLGLNYYLCGDNAKAMFGVEYDDLNSGSQDVYQGYTAWAAFRVYF